MRIGRLILIQALILVGLVALGAIGWYYWHQNYLYVTTQDASVQAPSIPVVASSSGTLKQVYVHVGQKVTVGQLLAQESVPVTGKGGAVTMHTISVTAPVAGAVSQVLGQSGAAVAAGSPILNEVQLNHITVVANIPESRIRHVAVGNTATVYIDSHPGVSFTGTVKYIQPATQSFYSILPSSATAGSYTKVVQRIPVTLSIDAAGYTLLPGENASVRVQIR